MLVLAVERSMCECRQVAGDGCVLSSSRSASTARTPEPPSEKAGESIACSGPAASLAPLFRSRASERQGGLCSSPPGSLRRSRDGESRGVRLGKGLPRRVLRFQQGC